MKKYLLEFLRRGLVACGFGPIVLAVIYFILQKCGVTDVLSVNEVCVGILSLSALAFVAGGMNVLYQMERLPLMAAILIHGSVLYIGYLGAYLINGWLESGWVPMLVFTGIFIFGYLVIWIIIYSIIKRNTEKMNLALLQKRRSE